MPVSLGLGSSGYLARKGAGKGAHTGQLSIKGSSVENSQGND